MDLSEIKAAGKECHELAKETAELCVETISKTREMVNTGESIKSTLEGFSQRGGMDASKLAIISDLVDGDKVKESITLGREVGDLSIKCVSKAAAMISRMEEGMRALPDFVEDMIEDFLFKEDDLQKADVSKDIEEIEKCRQAVMNLDITTVMSTGLSAFESLSLKANVCRTLFESVNDFSRNVASITDVFIQHDWMEAASRFKDIFKCISLSRSIKQYAEEAGKLINYVIGLFQDSSRGLGTIWKALDYAKEKLSDCLEFIMHVRSQCVDALEKSTLLINTTRQIKDQLDTSSMDLESLSKLAELLDGDEIRTTIHVAKNIDDTLHTSSEEVVKMIEKVTDAYQNLPEVISVDLEEGKVDGTRDIQDIERHLEELNTSRVSVEDADVFMTIQRSREGFSNIADKAEICNEMLRESQGFADSSIATIESFMGVWDFDLARDKIVDVCRLVKMGELLKVFAEQVIKLVERMILLMKACIQKMSNILPEDIAENLSSMLCSINQVTEMISSFKLW